MSPGQLWWGEQSLCARRGPGREVLGSGEFVQQSLLRLQIGGAKSFGEPLINRRQQIARLADAVAVAQQAGEARGSTQLPRVRPLPARPVERLPKVILGRRRGSRARPATAEARL